MGRQRGFTLFELMVVVALIGFLAAVALSRFAEMQEAAEEMAVEYDVSALRSALMIRSTELISARDWAALKSLAGQNPFPLLGTLPVNYGGEYSGTAKKGYWYYDTASMEVLYRVRHDSSLLAPGENGLLRFRVVGVNSVGQAANGVGVAYVVLRPAEAYVWASRPLR